MRPKPQTFVQNDENLLQIALLAKRFHKLPSEILQIDYEVAALDFDLACSQCLAIYENKRKIEEIETLAKAIAVTCGLADKEIFDKPETDIQEW